MFVASAYQIFYLLALIQYVFSYVPAPVNVSAICHNFQNVLYWNYSAPSLKPQFSVEIKRQGNPVVNHVCSNTSLYHCDVSSFTKVIEESYLFIVTAAVGTQNNSSDVFFSYNGNMAIGSVVKCFLDFPPVNISAVSKEVIKVEFPHPFDRYKDDIQNNETEDCESFEYEVTYESELPKPQSPCYYEETPVCVAEIHVDVEQKNHCIKIKGTLCSVTVSEQIKCTEPFKSDNQYIWIIVGIFGALALLCLFILIVICLHRSLNGFSPLPQSLTTKLSGFRFISALSDTQSEVHTILSVSPTPEESVPDEMPTFVSNEQEDVFRLATGITNRELSSGEGSGMEQDTDMGRRSDYDCPHGLIVPVMEEMSPGDTVTGYRCES
ncbi:hypothetical protein UPYG_G00133250 [Umbra pygmaea]|uniref:Fibronectin type-III domain-containing protein n=1 Tax=Umbra pygmaea TaxID=75934 RepID=A0ABD0WTK3_UMBPY